MYFQKQLFLGINKVEFDNQQKLKRKLKVTGRSFFIGNTG